MTVAGLIAVFELTSQRGGTDRDRWNRLDHIILVP